MNRRRMIRRPAGWRIPAVPLAVAVGGLMLAAGCSDGATPTSPTAAGASAPFTLTGSVRDTLLRPVAGARIEVTDGTLAGRSTATDASGDFALEVAAPAGGTVQLRVSKDGYTPAAARGRSGNPAIVTLTPLSLVNLAGEYALTFTADAACTGLPAALRTRTYAAAITRPRAEHYGVVVQLGGAAFASGYGSFSGLLGDDATRLLVYSWEAMNRWLEDHPVIERIDGGALSYMGAADVNVGANATTFTGAFDGSISYCSAAASDPRSPDFPPVCSVPATVCRSTGHQVSLSRR